MLVLRSCQLPAASSSDPLPVAGDFSCEIELRCALMIRSEDNLSGMFAVAALVAGIGMLVLQGLGGYGSTLAVEPSATGAFLLPVFVGIWFIHVVAYLMGRRVRAGSHIGLVYLIAQLGLVVGLTLASGRAASVLVLYVIWAAQAVVFYHRRWPVALIACGTVALIAMSRNPTETQEVMTIVTILTMIVMATYLVSHVRGVLVRREAKDLIEELSSTQSELSGYANQVEQVALLNERQRMARELHDTLAQGLVGVTLQLEAADSQLEKGGAARAREIVGEAMSRARETLANARRAIHDLRENQDVGELGHVLRREASRFATASGIHCDIDVQLHSEPTGRVAEVVKCVVTEGLTNVARHSRAQSARVRVASLSGGLDVVVSDDGVGFDASSTPSNGHYGLVGLRERVRQVGGALQIQSRIGHGATLTFSCDATSRNEGQKAADRDG